MDYRLRATMIALKVVCLLTQLGFGKPLQKLASQKKISCPKGTLLKWENGEESCVRCPLGKFMNKTNHRELSCIDCDSPPSAGSRKEIQYECTSESNTKIGCRRDTFRKNSSMGFYRCITCTVCKENEREIQPCTMEQNRICHSLPIPMSYLTPSRSSQTPCAPVLESSSLSPPLSQPQPQTTASTSNNSAAVATGGTASTEDVSKSIQELLKISQDKLYLMNMLLIAILVLMVIIAIISGIILVMKLLFYKSHAGRTNEQSKLKTPIPESNNSGTGQENKPLLEGDQYYSDDGSTAEHNGSNMSGRQVPSTQETNFDAAPEDTTHQGPKMGKRSQKTKQKTT